MKWYSIVDAKGNIQMVNSNDTKNVVKVVAAAESYITGQNLFEALRKSMLFELNLVE